MKNFLLLPISWLFFLSTIAVAQDNFQKCYTDQLIEQGRQNPEIVQRMDNVEHFIQQWVQQHHSDMNRQQEVLTIPVVVHVVYANSASNISDAKIYSQIDELNRIFRRTNTNANETRDIFLPVAADAEIEFCMAQRDPQGLPTNGITRTPTDSTNFETDAMKNNNTGGKTGWPTNQYLNIWVVNRLRGGNVLGYAYIPGNAPSPSVDGLAIAHNCFGTLPPNLPQYGNGRTAAHEIGHWLGLYHPWAQGNDAGNCTDDDLVSDTPQTSDPNYQCSFTANSCGSGTTDLPDMVENYMDYATDLCQNVFTLGQKTRMRSVLSFGGARYSVSQNAIACQPIEQGPNDAVLLDVGSPTGPNNCTTVSPVLEIQNFGTMPIFYMIVNYSIDGGTTQQYEWVNEANPLQPLDTLTLTLPPTNTITNGLVHSLSFDITNVNASNDFSPNNNSKDITFATISVGGALPIIEGFESAFPATSWSLNNPDATTSGIGFAQTNTGNNSTKSIYMHNFFYTATDAIDEVELPRLNFSTYETLSLNFDVAYCLKNAGDESDILEVLASKDCEQSYQTIATFTGADLETLAPQNSEFTPTTAQWQTKTVNLSNLLGAKNVILKFRQTRKEGNNLFLDNININGSVIGMNPIATPKTQQVRLYPNPSSRQVTLTIDHATADDMNIALFDQTGKLIRQQQYAVQRGSNAVPLAIDQLPNGIYFVVVQSNTLYHSQKLLVLH